MTGMPRARVVSAALALCGVLATIAGNASRVAAQAPAATEPATEAVTVESSSGPIPGSLVRPVQPRGPIPVILLIKDPSAGAPASVTAAGESALAHALAGLGIATVSYDAKGRPDEAAVAWISRLRNDPRFSTITVLGNERGAIVGVFAARAARADGFVSMAGESGGRMDLTLEISKLTVPVLLLKDELGSADALRRFVGGLRGPGTPMPRRPQGQRRSLRSVALGDVAGARVSIEYGGPSKRGRVIWGALVPYGRWWMPGADEATTFTTSGDVMLGALRVPAGDYTLYTEPTAEGLTLIVNRDTWQFHTEYQPANDLGRVVAETRTLAEPVETMTFAFEPQADGGSALILRWDDREFMVPLTRAHD